MPNITEYDADKYRDGGEGMVAWCNDHVRVSVYPVGETIPTWMLMGKLPDTPHPETGRSYKEMWEGQQEILKAALQMKDNRFIHKLIVLCWQRGDGKSLMVCLIVLWKFFNWPRQQIVLGANSASQVRFVHYDIIRDIILNSPKLLSKIGRRNIKEKEITIVDKVKKRQSIIRAISSFSGIMSNISAYTFSEMFDMKNPKFFVQIDGSTRNIPNALGLIDSTVSEKSHVLYRLYETSKKKKDPALFFSYRFSQKGDAKDFFNPNMTQQQLDSYKEKFPFGEFERYFKNLWSAGAERVFTDEMIEASNYLGIDKQVNVHPALMEIMTSKHTLMRQEQKIITRAGDPELNEAKNPEIVAQLESQHEPLFDEMERRLWPVSNAYELRDTITGTPAMATIEDLNKMSEIYDTDWAILTGMDRADPMKARTAARTVVIAVAKGLAGSRTNPFPVDESEAPRYLYILLHLANIEDHSIEVVQDTLIAIKDEFDGIDSFGTERWGAVDLVSWCDSNNISANIYYPTYSRQRTMFTELFLAYKNGRFKTPPVWVRGSKEDDVLKEEVGVFDHNPAASKGKFGSPEKRDKYGRQDDCMFALGSAIYGGLSLGVEAFRERKGMKSYGFFYQDTGLTGSYR
jgi:hypothetical protein